jgi:hypothetical protein
MVEANRWLARTEAILRKPRVERATPEPEVEAAPERPAPPPAKRAREDDDDTDELPF